MGKTSMGYATMLKQIKAVCAWNTLTAIFSEFQIVPNYVVKVKAAFALINYSSNSR